MPTQNNSNKWHEIWEKRSDSGEESILQTLIYLDGFDSGAGKISEDVWLSYSERLAQKLGITQDHSVYDVGCGAGAFLYPFYKNEMTVGGIDFSKTQIAYAAQYMPESNDFIAAGADDMPARPEYDFVFSNGVFHYFPDLEYAMRVLVKMWDKTIHTMMVCEVPDLDLKQQSEDMRRGALSESQYDKKYKGLEHLYFSRDFFEDFAKSKGCTAEIYNQDIENYPQNAYRFNCIIRKKG